MEGGASASQDCTCREEAGRHDENCPSLRSLAAYADDAEQLAAPQGCRCSPYAPHAADCPVRIEVLAENIAVPQDYLTRALRAIAEDADALAAEQLLRAVTYTSKFWKDGKPVGRTTDYGKTNPDEDFAECYSAVVRNKTKDCNSARFTWLRQYAFQGTDLD